MVTQSISPSRRPPVASGEEALRSFRALHAVLERVRPELDAAVEAAAREIPVFATLLESMDPAAREAQAEVSRELERAALLDDEWEAQDAYQRQLGTAYAHLGVAFEDWVALLRPFRSVVEDQILSGRTRDERAALTGMNLFLDRALTSLAAAYIETKEQLVRKAEAQLDLHEQMFRVSPLGKLIYEWESPPDRGTFRLVAANPQATAITGARTIERIDRTVGDGETVLEGELPDRLAGVIEEAEPERWTARRVIGGSERVFDCRAFAMGPTTVGVMFEDVTDRVHTEQALARHAKELERSNRELDEFAYVASHDLKAPLRDIDTLSAWIVDDVAEALPEESRRHLMTIRERITRMERLLDDLLQYSRAGRVFPDPEPLELRAVVANVLGVASAPPELEVVVTGEAPPVRTPRAPLELVLRNLVQNAFKHHPPGPGRVEIHLSSADEQVEIAVIDDGPGIAPEFHERVFRMFQTLRPRDDVEGSGMGLAIVKKVVEAYGGDVRLESELGHGATFRVRWPREWQRPEQKQKKR